MRDSNLRATNAPIAAPTLLIGGSHDTITSIERGNAVAAAIPDRTLPLLPGVHLLNVEMPAVFLHAV